MNYLFIITWFLFCCLQNIFSFQDNDHIVYKKNDMSIISNSDTIVFGAGCFWCVEAIFQKVEGVIDVLPGYCNGFTENPTYNQVCSGKSGHAEVARVIFNPNEVSLDHLFEVFWKTHDPTTLNRQGNDVGSQYRSGIFCLTKHQFDLAKKYKAKLELENIWPNPIVTEIEMLDKFYIAENYHHNYYNNNKSQGYCIYVIKPKIEKYNKVFKTFNSDK